MAFRAVELPNGQTKGLGWLGRKPDHRDHIFGFTPSTDGMLTGNYPEEMDLTGYFGPVIDQGQFNKCTGAAMAGLYSSTYLGADPPRPAIPLSDDFVYYYARTYSGMQNQDGGAYIRDVVRAAHEYGLCRKELWTATRQTINRRPSQQAQSEAQQHQIVEYLSVPMNRDAILDVLGQMYPVIIGFTVFDSMPNAANGDVPMPRSNERELGGHAVVLCGYSLASGKVFFRNSWGQWGNHGYGTFPIDFITNSKYADDPWVIRTSEID